MNDEIKDLVVIQFERQLSYFAFNWGIIIGFAMLCHHFFVFPIYLISVIVIGARQHALAVLAHDAAHYRISRNKMLNDFVSNFFSSFGVLMGTHAYRLHHFKHHHHLNTGEDPDWARKIHLSEWQFPMSQQSLYRVFMRQVWRGGIEWIQLTTKMFWMTFRSGKQNPLRKEAIGLLLYWCLVLGTVIHFHYLLQLFLYWVVPMLTIFPLVQRIRSVSEHFGVTRDRILNQTRNVRAPLIERFLLSPHSVNWHLVHHLYPAIPHYNLHRANQILSKNPDYLKDQHLNESYFISENSVLKDLLKDSDDEIRKVA